MRTMAALFAAAIGFAGAAGAGEPNGRVGDDPIGGLLARMGYRPVIETDAEGQLHHTIGYKVAGLECRVDVSLSRDGTKVWIGTRLERAGKPAAEGLSPAALVKLLQANADMLSQFAVGDDGKALFLRRHLDNRDVTAEVLRDQFDRFTSDMKRTQDLWAKPLPSALDLYPVERGYGSPTLSRLGTPAGNGPNPFVVGR